MQITVICAWCKKFMYYKDSEGSDPSAYPISHSICPECKKIVDEEIKRIKGGNHEREHQAYIG